MKQTNQKKQMITTIMSEYAQIFEESLNSINYNKRKLTFRQICETYYDLIEEEQKMFWTFLNQKTGKSISNLKHIYTYHLNSEDKQNIKQYVEANSHQSVKELVNNLVNNQFQGKDVFYYEIYHVVYRAHARQVVKQYKTVQKSESE
ncbi:Hypothetical_protein [Hexamita inflata]|uniref:Hypothetical_protein n=1 Tax=Hexamita inflata TaxID=28002 RepID=A0AA86UYZ2_9EUKA|nr:Hypothetical protein HINF_LOCUS65310 [Hexamita inflata]